MARDAAKWLTPESLTLLRGMACMGKDAGQIAACMGISLATCLLSIILYLSYFEFFPEVTENER